MRRLPNTTPRRSAAEWRRLVSRWERSGQSAAAFAEKHSLGKRSLVWWRWKLTSAGRAADAEPTLTFVPLEASGPELATARWVVQTPAGVRVEMSGGSALVVEALGVALDRLHGGAAR